jgi:hypothetical protein
MARLAEATTPQPEKQGPVTIDLSSTVHVKPSEKAKPKGKTKK